jgi:Reverse transcriptase (RNA-dependent DNA polymerase)
VADEDIPKTAVITPFGLFEFIRMPFGLKNAGMTFQRMMDQIFANIPYIFVYLDDVLVASRNMEEHQHHLRQVLTLL